MIQHMENLLNLSSQLLAQVPVDGAVNTNEEAALVFSGPQFLVALISGLVLAFAFQLLLTNLSVALGISVLGRSSDDDHSDHSHDEGGSVGGTIKKIGFAAGLWTLITVTIALFLACLLAVKLSLITSSGLGAIVGVVIWGAYFTLLVWFGSSTVGSLIGSVVNTATAGFQSIVGTATAALGARAVNDQVVSTAEAAAAAVRRELGSAISPGHIRDSIEDYLDAIRPGELDMSKIRREFERLVDDPELRSLVGTGSPVEIADRLRQVDRSTFVNLVSNRTDLSKRDAQRLVEQLESVWHSVIGQYQQRRDPMAELVDYLKTVQPNALNNNELAARLDRLTEEVRRQSDLQQQQGSIVQQQQSSMMQMASSAMRPAGGKEEASLLDRAMQFGFSTLMGTVMGRTDLSDLDVEKILGQLQGVKDKVTDKAKQVASSTPGVPFNTIRADAENYLLNSYAWHFNRATLETEFYDVLYDPQADPGTVRRQIEQLDRGFFVDVLTRRNDLAPARINEVADHLETIRNGVLSTVRSAESQEHSQDLRSRVEHYLRNTNKDELNPEGIERDFHLLLEDRESGYDALRDRLSHFDRNTLVALLSQRQDLAPEEADRIVGQLESTRDRVLGSAQEVQERAKSQALELRGRVEGYLRNTDKTELSPEGIKRDFSLLLNDPQAGAYALRERVSQFDRDTLVQLLAQRQDMTPEEANRIVSQLEDVRNTVLHAPQIAVDKAKDQYDQVTTALAEYLRRTNRPELDPEGLQRDLNTLLHDPKQGTLALRRRLSQVDRETLVQLLAQRQDLSPEQANQLIDQTLTSIRNLVRAPRRLAARTQQRVTSFQSTLEDYLRNTDKAALNPDGIKQDLSLLLRDPRTGLGNLGSRVAELDRPTIVALLSQRQDMTEEEANRVVDQVLSVREQFVAQIQGIQTRIQSVIDGIFARIRDYLNALDRPELNYEGIRRDVRTLFYDPKAGFDALRDRLGSFNRDTLVALMSSREDISEAQANRIIDQVESARASVLQRADRIQDEAQRRVEQVKRQAQKQVEETRKAAATAAWWLFGTALTSGAAAAIAGAIAVGRQ
ncbi:MFS transporter [Leptolyngbya sp. FACHB-36]|uniref:MFS transporter n=1 Tax=Leptolyngbya sp. FACHB-36 TaxID=2692808 RepID=UPI00168140F2|nr:MFS transporter [Leptolyngbya sp. FACHB-36]MBD2021863.1 MFS transporter [Leptolyngbya sp. FACHB-36]